MIELDPDSEENSEFARCTCLDRARIALEQTGQVHCAGVMKELQDLVDRGAKMLDKDPNRPIEVVDWFIRYFDDDYR